MDALRVLGRRWLVVLLGAALTAAACAYAVLSVETQYQARAQYLLLLPAAATGKDSPTNPYINMNGGLVFVAGLIAADMNTPAVARDMVAQGFDSEYSIALGTSGGPAVDVQVSGVNKDNVLQTRDELLRRFDARLSELQRLPDIPRKQEIFSRTNAVDQEAEVLPGAKAKALILFGAIGVALTLAAAFAVEGIARRRSRGPGNRALPASPNR